MAPDEDERAARIRSFDGTILSARRLGPQEGLPLLIAPAVGVDLEIWRGVVVDVVRERPIVSWDLRGLHDSGPPGSGRVDPEAQALDAIAVADHFGISTFALASWSTGGRIALEIAHAHPGRVERLALVCAGYGYSVRRLLRYQEIASLLPVAAVVGRAVALPAQTLVRRFVGRPELPGIIRQSGLLASSADADLAARIFRKAADCDPRVLLSTFRAVAGAPVPALLPQIEVPTLLVGGERDFITPRRVLEEMAREMPDAQLDIFEDASHYLPLEYPARLSIDLRDFLGSSG